jgi:hypothetical protein
VKLAALSLVYGIIVRELPDQDILSYSAINVDNDEKPELS